MTEAVYGSFLSKFNKTADGKVAKLYKEKFIVAIRSTIQGSVFFVKARVAAEMKKRVVYVVDVAFDVNGVVLESQCECGAGMGPEAHCKHVCLLIYALIQFSLFNKIEVHETCTDRIQSFHRAKKFNGSPIKSENLRLRSKVTDQPSISSLKDFDPRPQKLRNTKEYPSFFFNICMNSGMNSMPINQLVPPANLYAVAHDHDYLELSPEDAFLQSMNIGRKSVTDETVQKIEMATRGQCKNAKWFFERCMRVTSSSFGRICKATALTNLTNLAKRLTESAVIKSAPLEHGRMFESIALRKFMDMTGNDVKESGLVVNKSDPFLASSPDGLVGTNSVVEVKCPYSARDNTISKTTVPYLLENEDGTYGLNNRHDYYYQVQGQMLCTGRELCHFVIYTSQDMQVIEIQRDDVFIQEMVNTLRNFYDNYFREALLAKFFYRNYKQFSFYSE